jgi:hypothetical protein
MPDPWLTFAPLQPDGIVPAEINLPYHFSEQVSLRPIPEWVRQGDTVDELRPQLRDKIENDGNRHCLGVEYQADAFGSPDPSWKGDPPWSMQDTAAQWIRSAHLALWLARPTGLSFNIVIDAVMHGPEWVTRGTTTYAETYALPEHQHERHTLEDFGTARTLFNAFLRVSQGGPVHTAALVTMKALGDQTWEFRFLLMWLVLECLFGPETPQETTFRLSQRMAFFLEKEGSKAREVYTRIKKSYEWRSNIVHGLRLSNLQREKSNSLLVELEELVRRSLVGILASENSTEIFDGGRREEYLDSLAFR